MYMQQMFQNCKSRKHGIRIKIFFFFFAIFLRTLASQYIESNLFTHS